MGIDGPGRGGTSEPGPAGVLLDEYVLQRRLPSCDADGADVWLARERAGISEVLVHVVSLPSVAQARHEFVATAHACIRAVGPQLAQGREVIVGEHALAMVWNVPSGRPWADAAGSPLELERGRGLAERLGWQLADPSAGGAWVTDSGRVLVVPAPRRVTDPPSDEPGVSSEAVPALALRPESPRRLMRTRRAARGRSVDAAAFRRVGLPAVVVIVAVALGLVSVRVWRDAPTPVAQVADEHRSPVSANPNGAGEPEPDWKAVLERLDASRTAAYEAADPSAVPFFAVPGSPAAEQDQAILTDLAVQGLHAQGYAPMVEQIEPLTVHAGRAVLAVTDSVAAYRWVDGQSTVVREMAGRGSMAWRLELREVGQGWRIFAASAAT